MAYLTRIFSVLVILSVSVMDVAAQGQEWSSLIPLVSTRSDVERILGKPKESFENFGRYETQLGKYNVWYASGNCRRSEGRDWNVPSNKMILLHFSPKKTVPIEKYLSDVGSFLRTESPGGYSRYLYTSRDESVIYTTIKSPDSSEIIDRIWLEPGKLGEHLRCLPSRN